MKEARRAVSTCCQQLRDIALPDERHQSWTVARFYVISDEECSFTEFYGLRQFRRIQLLHLHYSGTSLARKPRPLDDCWWNRKYAIKGTILPTHDPLNYM